MIFVAHVSPEAFSSFIESVSLVPVNFVSHFSPEVPLQLHRVREHDTGEFGVPFFTQRYVFNYIGSGWLVKLVSRFSPDVFL